MRATPPGILLSMGKRQTLHLHSITENELVSRCQKGDERGFKLLVDRYGPKLMAIAFRYSADRFTAEDILQEALIKVFRKIPDYTGKGSFEGWLKRIVVTTALNHYKKTQSRRESFQREELVYEDEGQVSTLDQLSADELMKEISSLPEGYRMVFNLFIVEGYDHREIAGMLGISEGTSRSQLAKAKKKLATRLVANGIVARA